MEYRLARCFICCRQLAIFAYYRYLELVYRRAVSVQQPLHLNMRQSNNYRGWEQL